MSFLDKFFVVVSGGGMQAGAAELQRLTWLTRAVCTSLGMGFKAWSQPTRPGKAVSMHALFTSCKC